ncbi:hypothetical protein A3Q56_05365, partial [Intoshia linei]
WQFKINVRTFLKILQLSKNFKMQSESDYITNVEFRHYIKDVRLLSAVNRKGIFALSEIQSKTFPKILEEPHNNIIAQSRSGTGKTTCIAISTLLRVDMNKNETQVVIILPTYELAKQILDFYSDIVENVMMERIANATRGQRLKKSDNVPIIVVGTPGTLLLWVEVFKTVDFSQLSVFILDEADKMIHENGFKKQTIDLSSYVNPDVQRILFSATFDEEVMEFAKTFAPNAALFQVELRHQCLKNISQVYIKTPKDLLAKMERIYSIYKSFDVGQCIVFCPTRILTNKLYDYMKHEFSVCVLSGEMEITERNKSILDFRSGKYKIMITTNVTSRGIDIPDCTLVINFSIPRGADKKPSPEDYLHRIGRTGRFGKKGIALNLIDSDYELESLMAIQKYYRITSHKRYGKV